MERSERRKDSADGDAPDSLERYAKAEAILNRTLAYHAAISVAELKNSLGINVLEMRLVVAENRNGTFEVTCSLERVAAQPSFETQTAVHPIAPHAKGDGGAPLDPGTDAPGATT